MNKGPSVAIKSCSESARNDRRSSCIPIAACPLFFPFFYELPDLKHFFSVTFLTPKSIFSVVHLFFFLSLEFNLVELLLFVLARRYGLVSSTLFFSRMGEKQRFPSTPRSVGAGLPLPPFPIYLLPHVSGSIQCELVGPEMDDRGEVVAPAVSFFVRNSILLYFLFAGMLNGTPFFFFLVFGGGGFPAFR